jgi:hypothetical protein
MRTSENSVQKKFTRKAYSPGPELAVQQPE